MKRKLTKNLTCLSALALGLSAGGAFAADQTWNFDDAANPTNGFTIVGGHPSYYYATGGNPDNGGYLSVADGNVAGQALVVVFPDIDEGYPVKAFHLTMDVRAGNGDTERPADGFSICYAREGDPVLKNATNGAAGGAAGGDDAATTTNPAGSSDFENGTKTGVAICFDAWAGNWLPDTGAGGVPGPDTEGIEIRVDDHTLKQIDMSADRNGGCSVATTNDISGCSNNVCGDFNTEQTGPWINDGGSPLPLCWAPLDVELDTNKQVTVIWKGHVFLDHYQLASYSSHRGRLILMGRTGGNHQNVHFDNIRLVTVPAVEATFGGLQAGPGLNQFTFAIDDNGSSVVTNVSLVKLDGADVTSQVVITRSGGVTTGVYSGANRFDSASKHTVEVTWQTSLGQTLSVSPAPTFTTMSWTVLPAAMALPDSSIDKGQAGFRVVAHQVASGEPNRMYWADEQLMGLHGTNAIDYSVLQTVDGEIPWTDLMDFGNDAANSTTGQFGPDRNWSFFGIPGTGLTVDDNSAVEVTAYLYFPQAGTYVMGGNSDDSLRVTYAKNSHDMLGTRVQGLFSDVGRGISSDENVGALIVDTPGYYGFRMLFENGSGGCALEWYFKSTPAGTTNVLINDTLNNPNTTVLAYQVSSAAPPYVSHAEPPLDDDQVYPDQTLKYQLTDGNTTVNSGSVVLKVNGITQSASVSKSGSVTTITQTAPATFWPKGTNTVELSFKDSASANYDYQYSFVVGPYVTLDAGQAVPLGSQDTTKPGFVLTTAQIDFASVNDSGDGIANQVDEANGLIAGLFFPWYGANASTVAGPSTWTGPVDFNIVTSAGDFTNDFLLPGIPGKAGSSENLAAQFQFWLVFPNAGFYRLGVSSDDGFRVSEGFAPIRQALHVTGTGIDKDVGAVVSSTANGNGGFGIPLPVNPITAPVVYVSSTNCPNLPDLTGKIAVADHLLCNNNDSALVMALQNAGAVGAIIINDPTFGFPYVMTGNPGGTVTIPALNVNGFGGERDFWITNANLTATIGASSTLQLGAADYGKGMGWIDFGVAVPQAGVYPLNLIYEQGGGGGGLEFSELLSNGTRILVNDNNNSAALKAYRAVKVGPRPTVTIKSSAGMTTITYTGTLQSSATVNGTYTDVQGASSPYTVPTASATMQFYRAR